MIKPKVVVVVAEVMVQTTRNDIERENNMRVGIENDSSR